MTVIKDNDKSSAINLYSVYQLVREIKAGNITLPTIQRGFVWRPHQIENLWDSVLRGYPIGSFTACQFSSSKIEILDGQQRATALALAFDDRPDLRNIPAGVIKANSNGRILKANFDKWQIYIDLLRPARGESANDERQYIFRVITQAQPWGYDLKNNQEKLNSGRIYAAIEQYRNTGFLDKSREYFNHDDLRSFYPWAAVAPVPFRFFLQPEVLDALGQADGPAKAAILIWNRIKQWLTLYKNIDNITDAKNLPDILINLFSGAAAKQTIIEYRHYYKMISPMEDDSFKNSDKSKYFFSLEEIAEAVYRFIISSKNIAVFTPTVLTEAHNDIDADIEKIFVRINTGGTKIKNEELNYSLLKFQLKDDDFINRLEARCLKIMAPAVFITIAYRLYTLMKQRQISIGLTVNPRQFGRELGSSVNDEHRTKVFDDFKKFIDTHFLNDDRNDQKTKLEDYKPNGNVSLLTAYEDLIKYHQQKNKLGFPLPLFFNFASKAPELVLLLWAALMKKGLPSCRIKITKVMSSLYFFSGNKQKSLENARTMVNSPLVDAERFWSSEILERTLWLEDWPIKKLDDLEKQDSMSTFALRHNREFLLYAQRKYIDKWFAEQLTELDETATPYDFDHILPHSFIYYRRFANDYIFKDLYNSIGNLRAWPYSLNRGDQDKGLEYKFHPLPSEQKEGDNIKYWKESPFFGDELKDVSDGEMLGKLTKCLLEASLCNDHGDFWGDTGKSITADTIAENQEKISNAIKGRLSYIYKSWLDEIQDILPNNEGVEKQYEQFFKEDCFGVDLITVNKEGDDDNITEFHHGYLKISNQFYISSANPDQNISLMANQNISLRLVLKNNTFEKYKEETKNFTGFENHGWVNSHHSHYMGFTLRSSSKEAKADLFLEMVMAINTLYPNSDLAAEFIKLLNEDLRQSIVKAIRKYKTREQESYLYIGTDLAAIESLFCNGRN